MQQRQAQPGSQLEPTPSHHTLRVTLDPEQPTTIDVGNYAHSVPHSPKDQGSWLKTSANQPQQDLPLVDLHHNGILENKTVEGQIASESEGIAGGCQSPSSSRQLLGPKVAKTDGRDLHLLSIEGRGVCGLSALIMLKEVLRQYQYSQKLPQIPRPCELFDLAGGAGTGGIIAIMLFRLEMTVDEAIVAYARLSADVFSKSSLLQSQKTKASRLENAFAKVICTSLDVNEIQGRKMHLLDEERPKCFVISSTAKNMLYPTLFRTYASPRLTSYNCTIVEATRATTAEDPFFPTIDIGDANMKETFVYGGSRINSPVKAVLQEANSIFPDQSVCCILSIGSGSQGIIGFEGTSTTNQAQVFKRLMNSDEQISDEVAKELREKDVFTWLNVDHGLEGINFDDWERLGDVRTHTQKYLEKFDVTQKVSRLVQILNQRTAITITVKETLTDFGNFLDGFISILADEHWGTIVSGMIRIAQPSKAATETLNVQCALLRDTLSSCLQGKDVTELPDEVKENVRTLLKGVKKTFNDSPGQENPISYFNTSIQKLLQHFWVKNHIAGNIVVHDILKFIQKDDSMRKTFTRLEQHAMNQNLGNLNISPFASYDSSEVSDKPSCFMGTRVRFLNEIANWMTGDDPNLAPIYVLDGVAGIGKSTIAKTVAEHAAGINLLGASFFFSRDDDKRKTTKTFFPTIAYQLAYYDKVFADGINDALLRAPHVVTQMPIKQFSTLIMEPLEGALAMAGSPILIVIDGLDECEHDGEVLLKIFADSIMKLPRLKIFITTRPEYHIRTILDRYHHLKRFQLQDIETSVVQSDLRLYLDFHLSDNQVRDKLPELKCTWKPEEKDVNVLIGICGTLFIIASTAVKFILDSKRSDPEKQLSRLLQGVSRRDFSGSERTTAMDSFYTQILLAAVPRDDKTGDEDEDWFDDYRIVVGTIVALQYPLPRDALSALLHVNGDYVIRTLSHLHSLVAPTGQDLTFRLHHKSFPDFVTSTSRCEQRFLINLKTRHLDLGKRCLSIMNARLKSNICNLASADRFKDNSFTQHLTQGRIAPELAYASTHWATHLCGAAKLDGEAEQLLESFAGKQLLAWLEVLSIIGQMEAAYSSLEKTRKLLGEYETTAGMTRQLFDDGCRFIALNIELFKVSAGHVFPASVFVPQDTDFFRTYGSLKGLHLGVVSGYEKTWNPTISITTGHGGPVNSVVSSSDGTRLASASDDETVRLWDGQTGAKIVVLRGHSHQVNSVVFSPDGTRLASASDDETVRLWDSQTGAEIAVLQGHTEWVNSVVFSPDGTRLASASEDRTVRLWDGRTEAEIAALRGHTESVNSVVFSPDGTRLASASEDRTVRLWDGQTGSKTAVLQGHWHQVNSVAFSPDSTRLASASDDQTVRLWDGRTGAEIAVLPGHSDRVDSVMFSPDSTKLASASDDQTVRLWDGRTGAEITLLQGHSHQVNSVVFSPDGTRLASASKDKTVRLWESRSGAEIAVLRGHTEWVNSVVFSRDGTRLASASDDQTVRLWDGRTDAEITVIPGHTEWVNSVLFSPDGTRLASASKDRTVRLWDGQTGAKIAVLRGHSHQVNSVVFSPDGTRLASASKDRTVRLWDGQTGAEIVVLHGHTKWRVNSVVFSPDGTRLASASDDQTVRLWDGQTGAEIAVLQGHTKRVNSVVFSSAGTQLASASDDDTVRLWDGQTGAEIVVLQGHSDRVNSVVFSPDGTRLASTSKDRTVRLWDGRKGAEIAVFQGHTKWVKSVVFSPDGTRLASASSDQKVRLWDGQTGAEIAIFSGRSPVSYISDGSALLLISHERLYQVSHSIRDELAMPLELFVDMEYHPQGAQLPGLNAWIILLKRTQPSLWGLLGVKADEGRVRFVSLCWFPPDLQITDYSDLSVSSLSRAAVGCEGGRVLLLDIDLSLV